MSTRSSGFKKIGGLTPKKKDMYITYMYNIVQYNKIDYEIM